MKVKLTTNIDYQLKQEADRHNLSYADVLDQAIRTRLAIKKGDINSIDRRQLEMDIEKEEEILDTHSAKLIKLRDQLKLVDEKDKETEKETLEKKKTEIMEQKTCFECGAIHDLKYNWKMFGERRICSACYFTAGAAEFKRWTGKGE